MLFQSHNFWLTVLKMSIKTGLSFFLTFCCMITLISGIIDHCCIMENLMRFKWNSEKNSNKLEQYTQKTLILKQQGQSPMLLVLIKKIVYQYLEVVVIFREGFRAYEYISVTNNGSSKSFNIYSFFEYLCRATGDILKVCFLFLFLNSVIPVIYVFITDFW